ncbi:MAG TPA: glycoside hydrolase family 2 TIM barrel-domain containing protein [Terriglobales bacterium]|nr:glycoside hydrolase family 2 TIM barrel-domain containing protein [Terriglobales bacterium]
MDQSNKFSRRDFLKTSALVTAAAVATPSAFTTDQTPRQNPERLITGWEHCRSSLSGPWDVWHGSFDKSKEHWSQVELPHCFNAREAVDPDENYYRGQGWYRTNLKLANPFPNGRTLLHFEGAGQKSKVFIDLDQVGTEHVGGYDEWIVDITEAVAKAQANQQSKNGIPLAIVCDNSRDLEMLPSDFSDFNLYGGIYRYLNLVYVPAIWIERLHIFSALQPNGSAEVQVLSLVNLQAFLEDSGLRLGPVSIEVRVLDPSGQVVHSSTVNDGTWKGERVLTTFTISKPKLWSPSAPALYRCEATLKSSHGEMTVSERFGVRHFEFVTHGPFKLNGERLLIRGTQRHEDHAGIGAAMTEDLIRKEMQMIKDVGANFIRLAHYQQSRIVLDLCDELGIMVWEEIPWCRSGIGNDVWQQQAHRMLRNMIDQHYNHPAVILWGLGNEDDWPGEFPSEDQQAIRAFMSQLNDEAHKLDPTRMTSIRRCDFAKDIPDVYSPSIWAGWYRGRYTEYKSSVEEEMQKVNHFIHMEWGGDSHARRHSEDPDKVIAQIATGKGTDERGLDFLRTGGIARASRDGDWSETYICNLFDWYLKEQETMPLLTGSAQWIFKDFSTPERPENPIPKVNQKGLVERDFTPKEGYYVFQSYWAEKPMVHIYGHTWPIRWGDAGEEKLVKVYSNCETVELIVNGQSQGIKTRNSQDFPAAGLRWMIKLAPENHVRAIGRRGSRTVEDEIHFQYQTQKWGRPAQLRLRELSRNGDAVTVETQLLDANGLLCLDARNQVHFGISGDGTLIDDLGTDTGSRVVELYNGRAMLSLKRNGGTSELSISSKNIPTIYMLVV